MKLSLSISLASGCGENQAGGGGGGGSCCHYILSAKLIEDQTFVLFKNIDYSRVLFTFLLAYCSHFLHFHIRLKTIMADNQFLVRGINADSLPEINSDTTAKISL